MKRSRSWAALIGAATAALALAQPAAAADEGLALRRVLLSSGGVGYFEYEARVAGEAALPLSVRLDQVDDVLKSIVVFDDQGGAGEVTLPAKAAASEAFRDLPIDPSALTSEPALLEALRGAEVRVTTADGDVTGRVLSVTAEVTQLPDQGGNVVRHRLAIAAGGAVSSVILEEAATVRFVDPTLSAELDAALRSVLDQKDRGRRTLTIHASGSGERRVRVGYVVAVPLWKSTYRLTLPPDPQAKTAELTGLAMVENESGADFQDVDLTLVSGDPVTFRQALYQAYYVDRPEVPVEVAGRVLPRLDEGAVAVANKHGAEGRAGMGYVMPAPSADGAAAMAPSMGPMAPPAPTAPTEATELETQVVFHVPRPITLAAGEAALIPIVDRAVPAERVSVYQPDVEARHPLASVRLTNDGDTGLPPGVITTYERGADATTYLGDARLAALPVGEERLVTFGVDTKVTIDRRDRKAQTITLATIAGGVLRLVRTERRTTEYVIAGAAREPRTVIVEQPRLEGFEIAAPREGVEATADRYRVRVDVPAGSVTKLDVTLERPVTERVVIADLSAADLGAYAAAAELPPAVRAALTRLAGLRAKVDEKAADVKNIDAEVARITAEQARIRENLKAVPAGSPLHARYLTELGDQEDRLAALAQKRADAQKALADAQKTLTDAIRAFHV